MAAPRNNRNAAKDGESFLVRIRLEQPDPLVKEAIQSMSPENRGRVLADHIISQASQSIIIVADCSRCGEPINATEPELILDGVRICESCHMIAMAANEE